MTLLQNATGDDCMSAVQVTIRWGQCRSLVTTTGIAVAFTERIFCRSAAVSPLPSYAPCGAWCFICMFNWRGGAAVTNLLPFRDSQGVGSETCRDSLQD